MQNRLYLKKLTNKLNFNEKSIFVYEFTGVNVSCIVFE